MQTPTGDPMGTSMRIYNDRTHQNDPVELPGSFSLSPSHPTHERNASSGNSLTKTSTTTNQTSNTDETHSQKRVDANHELYILESDSADIQQVPSVKLNLSSVKRYSSVLYEHLMKDRGNGVGFSTLSASKPTPLHVCTDSLRLFVSRVDHMPSTPSVMAYQDIQMSFPQFLELSTILWEYKCSIDQWLPVADQMKKQWPRDRNCDRLLSWIFLGLLYNWPELFEEASLELVSNCSGFQVALDAAKFIPQQLRGTLQETRKQHVLETFLFIKRKWSLMFEPRETSQTRLYASICDGLLNEYGVDVRMDTLPGNLYQSISPDNLLRQVEIIISRIHSNPSTIADLRRTDSPPQPRKGNSRTDQRQLDHFARGNRGAEAADALAQLFSIASNTWRRRKHATIDDNKCEVLLEDCRLFREDRLKPLSLTSFLEIRNHQLILGNN